MHPQPMFSKTRGSVSATTTTGLSMFGMTVHPIRESLETTTSTTGGASPAPRPVASSRSRQQQMTSRVGRAGWRRYAILPVALSAVALISEGCGGGTSAPKPTKQAVPTAGARQRHISARNFAVMYGKPEPLPQSLARGIEANGGFPLQAQKLPLLAQRAWVVPGHNRLCLVQANMNEVPGLACSQLRHVLANGMFVASVPSGAAGASSVRTVVGIVPNGVARVRIVAENAKPKTVPVVDNVFSLRDEGRAIPKSIELIRSD